MKLNYFKIKHAKPAEKSYIMPDGNGLQLEVTPNGKKHWRYCYQMGGQRTRISFGVFPKVSLKEARDMRCKVEELISRDINPIKLDIKDTEEARVPVRKEVDVISEEASNIGACVPLEYNGLPVVPTQFLAKLYGCRAKNIKQNYKRNEQRFFEGKHYFKVEGEELKSLKHLASKRGQVKISTQTPVVLLWTERGAARHAKMLETDAAWNVFEKLEDAYFNRERLPEAAEAQPNAPSMLRRYAELDVINSFAIAQSLGKGHEAVLSQIRALELPHDVYHANFLRGECIAWGRERISVISMTQTGFGILMQRFSGKKAQQLTISVMNEFACRQPRLAPGQPINGVDPRFLKRRVDAKRMLALRGALKVYAAIEGTTYEEKEAELCAYFSLPRIEDLGMESCGIAMEYAFEAINRPSNSFIEKHPEERKFSVNRAALRGALDVWAYFADTRSYESIMEEFEQMTGVASLNDVHPNEYFRLLLFVWGQVTTACALKQAC